MWQDYFKRACKAGFWVVLAIGVVYGIAHEAHSQIPGPGGGFPSRPKFTAVGIGTAAVSTNQPLTVDAAGTDNIVFQTTTAAGLAQIELIGQTSNALLGMCTSNTAAICSTTNAANDSDIFGTGTIHVQNVSNVDYATFTPYTPPSAGATDITPRRSVLTAAYTNSTTTSSATGLTVTLGVGTWEIEGFFSILSAINGDAISLIVNAGTAVISTHSTCVWSGWGNSAVLPPTNSVGLSATLAASVVEGVNVTQMRCSWIVTSAGTFAINAQSNTNTNLMTIEPGAFISATRYN